MEYPINYNILAEEFRDDQQEFSQDDAKWLLASLRTMCNAYDELLEKQEEIERRVASMVEILRQVQDDDQQGTP